MYSNKIQKKAIIFDFPFRLQIRKHSYNTNFMYFLKFLCFSCSFACFYVHEFLAIECVQRIRANYIHKMLFIHMLFLPTTTKANSMYKNQLFVCIAVCLGSERGAKLNVLGNKRLPFSGPYISNTFQS